MLEFILARFNYWIYIILMMIGLYAMIAKNNMIKKLIGMTVFQTAIILFYVSIGVKSEATIPILVKDDMYHAETSQGGDPPPAHHIESANYANPLPHVLMLTAIVVGVATLGVALSVTQKVYQQYGSIEESDIRGQIRS